MNTEQPSAFPGSDSAVFPSWRASFLALVHFEEVKKRPITSTCVTETAAESGACFRQDNNVPWGLMELQMGCRSQNLARLTDNSSSLLGPTSAEHQPNRTLVCETVRAMVTEWRDIQLNRDQKSALKVFFSYICWFNSTSLISLFIFPHFLWKVSGTIKGSVAPSWILCKMSHRQPADSFG